MSLLEVVVIEDSSCIATVESRTVMNDENGNTVAVKLACHPLVPLYAVIIDHVLTWKKKQQVYFQTSM